MADLAYYIAKYIIPTADQRKICGRIRQLKEKRSCPNPVKYFFDNKEAPRTVHYVENVTKLGMLPPLLRPATLLPGQWKAFIYPEQVRSHWFLSLLKVLRALVYAKKKPTYKRYKHIDISRLITNVFCE